MDINQIIMLWMAGFLVVGFVGLVVCIVTKADYRQQNAWILVSVFWFAFVPALMIAAAFADELRRLGVIQIHDQDGD